MKKLLTILLFFLSTLTAECPIYKSWTECLFEVYWKDWNSYDKRTKTQLINMYNQSRHQDKYFDGKTLQDI